MIRRKFTVITACIRPENLPVIYRTLQPGKRLFDLTWLIVFDTSKVERPKEAFIQSFTQAQVIPSRYEILGISDATSVGGNAQRNYGMKFVKDGWLYFMDDDNCFHKDYWSAVYAAMDYYPRSAIIIGQQLVQTGQFRPVGPEYVKQDFIDTSQFTLKRSVMGEIQWPNSLYQSDAYIITTLFKANPARTVFIPKVISFYNRLRWEGVPA